MHLVIGVSEAYALEVSGKRWEHGHCHGWLEIGRHLAGEQLHELRQLGRHLRGNIGVDSRLLGGLLSQIILAGKFYRHLHLFWHYGRLSHLASTVHGSKSLLLVLAIDKDYLLDPFGIVVADVTQIKRLSVDEVVAIARSRIRTYLRRQLLHNHLVRNALVGLFILHSIGSLSRLLLLALYRLEIYGWSGRRR